MNPLISIIIPVYNVENYLAECLDSVLSQTYDQIEILTVDDGSTDTSLSILHSYARKDKRIKILRKTNGGLSDARNYGMKYAKGEYWFFPDSDDLIEKTAVEDLYEAIRSTNSDIAVCDMTYFYEDGHTSVSSGGNFTCTSIQEDPSLITINNSACNKLYKASLFEDLQFPFGRYYEDLATVPILLYKAQKVVKVNKALYHYRQRSGSIAHTANKKIFDIYDAIDDIYAYVQSHGREEKILEEIRHLYVIHGLDLTTLRIKDFDDKTIREEYLKENMERLKKSYPAYAKDSAYRKAGIKKKMIYTLLRAKAWNMVLKIYDR
ncbi:MAG: glycosyltransferase [Solobacterium sp.]|nr:glycosyltransferase [Solobacterium sp.]